MLSADELSALLAEKEHLLRAIQIQQLELQVQLETLREAHAGIEQSQHRYADLYDFAPISYFTFDARGRILEVNLTGATMLGRDRQELFGLPFIALARMDDPASFWSHLRRCAAEPGPVVSELHFTSAAGPIDVQAVSTRAQHMPAPALAFHTAFTDISQRKSAEAEQVRLREAAEETQATFEALDHASVAVSVALARLPSSGFSGFLQVIVDEARALGRCDFAAIGLGTDPRQPFDPWVSSGMDPERARTIGRHPRAVGILGMVARGGRGVRVRDVRRHAAFAGLPAHHPEIRSFLAVPIVFAGRSMGNLYLANKHAKEAFSDRDEQILEMLADRVGFAIEIAQLSADRDRNESALRASIEARENVLAVVSHDLRTPLNAIALGVDALARDPSESQKVVGIIRSAAERMARLIGDLLQAATIEAGRFTIEPAVHPPELIVDECVRMLEAAVASAGVRLETFRESDLPPVTFDQGRMVQVLTNLLGNAIRFTPAGGTIRIAVERGAADLRFSVSDTGPGIAEGLQARLFDRYWKGSSTGTGLGLYIARGIVELHGGRIWVESQPGAGSTFFFTLPL